MFFHFPSNRPDGIFLGTSRTLASARFTFSPEVLRYVRASSVDTVPAKMKQVLACKGWVAGIAFHLARLVLASGR